MEGTDAGSTGEQAEAPGEVVTVDAENEIPEAPVQEEAPTVLSVRGIADAEVVKSYSERIAEELLKIFVDTGS